MGPTILYSEDAHPILAEPSQEIVETRCHNRNSRLKHGYLRMSVSPGKTCSNGPFSARHFRLRGDEASTPTSAIFAGGHFLGFRRLFFLRFVGFAGASRPASPPF